MLKTPAWVKVKLWRVPGEMVTGAAPFSSAGASRAGWQTWKKPEQRTCVSVVLWFWKVSVAPRLMVQERKKKLSSSMATVLPQGEPVLPATGLVLAPVLEVAVGLVDARTVAVGAAPRAVAPDALEAC